MVDLAEGQIINSHYFKHSQRTNTLRCEKCGLNYEFRDVACPATKEPPPVNPIPDRQDELNRGYQYHIEDYLMTEVEQPERENEQPEAVNESRPEEEKNVEHGQNQAGAQDAKPFEQDLDDDEDEEEDEEDEEEEPSQQDIDENNADTEVTARKEEE